MENDLKEKIVLFSGRYQPCHAGHICSIIRLAKVFKKVIVVILDYEEKKWPISYSKQIFREVFSEMPHLNVEFRVNKTHFGQITKAQLDEFRPFDIYAAGNVKVLRHIEDLGVPCLFVDRSYLFSAREIPLPED